MNRNKLKTYAPEARRDFIQAMTDRAAFYGLTASKIEPAVVRGDVAVIAGRDHPRAVADKRKKLEARVERDGFEKTMEALAYTWFNRLVAIRFMELHEYLDHGYRVLSHPEGKQTPEILEHAEHVDLPGLKKDMAIDLKLEGNRESELYRLLLTAQCNALHKAMPFLFERIDDETELLLPDNLLHSDSLIRKLIDGIDEDDWREVEVIGWLYQFYISEKKDEVIGKVVASADIPAATQLFTPNWIVKYLVQNSVGAQWLASRPTSSLRSLMDYYLPPAVQTGDVLALMEARPTDLKPDTITFLDPAVGSGHIVAEAYDLFLAMYLECGYTKKEAVRSILTKNLFGLDIDNRAAQLSGFSLLMKARADDRTILADPPLLNVLCFDDSSSLDSAKLADALLFEEGRYDLVPSDDLIPETIPEPTLSSHDYGGPVRKAISAIVNLFVDAGTIGSLINVPASILSILPLLDTAIAKPISRDLLRRNLQIEARDQLERLVRQARILSGKYDCVVANPPYMGAKGMNASLKSYASREYPDSKADLFAMFIERNLAFAADHGTVAMITMQSWMFISSYEGLRAKLLKNNTISSMAHLGSRAFDSISGEVVSTTAFVLKKCRIPNFNGNYLRLIDGISEAQKKESFRQAIAQLDCRLRFYASEETFKGIGGSPIVYWAIPEALKAFEYDGVAETYVVKKGMAIGDNAKFLRQWFEVPADDIEFSAKGPSDTSDKTWYPCLNGGPYRKWSSNKEAVVNWKDNGDAPKSAITERTGDHWSRYIISTDLFFKPGINWSDISTSSFSARLHSEGFAFTSITMAAFNDNEDPMSLLAFANSTVGTYFLSLLSPSMHYGIGEFKKLPLSPNFKNQTAITNAKDLLEISSADWDLFETSWGFASSPLVNGARSIVDAYNCMRAEWRARTVEMQKLEESNNRLFIDIYGLANDLLPDVPLNQITINNNPFYRYDDDLSEVDREDRMRSDTVREFMSYFMGCVMGRFSLDRPGLVYASNGNDGFDSAAYTKFEADSDGIVPLLDTDWGMIDDATDRLADFINCTFSPESLQENVKFIADGLGTNNGESPIAAIRKYLAGGFYKHHLAAYKKRPIYWLFCSGKQRAFQCLVYLHRYNEGTLARMRTEYVIPLQGQVGSRIEQIEADKGKASSTSQRKKLQKEQDDLKKKQTELLIFDEKLKHFSDQKISLNLGDGVKVNYSKFGDLLAEVKAVTGGKDDE